MTSITKAPKAPKAPKVVALTPLQRIEMGQKNLLKMLSLKTANISESQFKALQVNNISRLKQSEKFKNLSSNVLALIAANCDNIEFLVGADTPIKTANRLTQIASFLCDEKTSSSAIVTVSALQKLHKT